jgi:hypothetical protein
VEVWERVRYIEDIVPAKVKVTKIIIKEYFVVTASLRKYLLLSMLFQTVGLEFMRIFMLYF